MQVGDKKKAGVLSVVAVGAIGFVIFQLVPKAEAKAPGRAAPASSGSAAAAPAPLTITAPVIPVSARPVALERDPFAVGPKPTPRPSVGSGLPTPELSQVSKTSPGSLPPMPLGSGGGATDFQFPTEAASDLRPNAQAAKAPKKGAAEEKPAKSTDVESVAAKTIVRLLGVVESPKPIAIFTIGDLERTAEVGDEILPGLFIESIDLAGVTFRKVPGAKAAPRPLAPGEENSL